MQWYEKIKQLREACGMTQDDLAQLMGYSSRSSINKIEMGKADIPVSKLFAFAKALHTTPGDLLGVEPVQNEPELINPLEQELFAALRSLSEEERRETAELIHASIISRKQQ